MPSTAIRHLSYSPATREMRVTFTSGRRYAYAQVPPEVHAAFSTAQSRGAFFNYRVRDRFACRELERSNADRQRQRRA
ncbi:KTSC domain-containing protein [Tardiphaga sp.]|uniref:KTSC domain-containing protein n=1 Tax=Tardiphaga sp. TaxID=1926292 RepID=UPI0037D9CA47